MKSLFSFLLIVFCFNTACADFSNSSAWLHPLYIGPNEPFIIDIRGEWPTDCHPGEQKPVISEYTGDTALVEFETIVEHPTCNDVVTPYRVLVDMSDVVGSLEGEFRFIDITVRFGGAELVVEVPHPCIALCSPPPLPYDKKPEAGLYYSDGLEKQGLIIARQNDRMGAYPLIYDESGSSEWLFGGGGIVEDVFFINLTELTGGQCLGCPPPDDPPQMDVVGKLTMLMDSEGIIQVKVNDGLFEEYRPLEFGYGEYSVADLSEGTSYKIPNLTGRWALVDDNRDLWGETSQLPSTVLPLVFDIEQGIYRDPPLPVITPPPAESIEYSILNIEGEVVAEMVCGYVNEMLCDLKSPTFDDFDNWFRVNALSIERILMKNMAENDPSDGVRIGTGIAVRID